MEWQLGKTANFKKAKGIMKHFNYASTLKFNSEEVIASLPWCDRESVCVNEQDQEVDWLHRQKTDEWKPLWKVMSYYPYTTWTWTNHEKETSETNFSIGNRDETSGLARLLYEVWFGYVDRKYHKHDNKTALKLQNRLTGQIVYMGWYDGRFTVTELPPKTDSCSAVIEINED